MRALVHSHPLLVREFVLRFDQEVQLHLRQFYQRREDNLRVGNQLIWRALAQISLVAPLEDRFYLELE